jgi:hypothetical protein
MDAWYLLFDGTSVDGSGHGCYVGRTTDPEVAKAHFEKCRSDPYNVGDVQIVTDDTIKSYRWRMTWENK